jgi:hypothetical protein
MFKRCAIQIILLLMMAGSAPAVSLPRLDIGSGQVNTAAASITIPITLTNVDGVTIAGASLDIGYDTTLLGNPTAAIGPAGTAAVKDVSSNIVSPGVLRLGVFGLNTNVIADGVIANVTFPLKESAGIATLTNTPSATDPAGNDVAITGSNGVITIGSGKDSLTTSIIGSGSINNINPASPSFYCLGGICTALFDAGTSFTLRATPSANYTFAGWKENGCTGTGDCTFTLNAPTTFTVTFNPVPMVQVSGDPTPYQTLKSAYGSAPDNGVLSVRNLTFPEDFTLDRPIGITLKGGVDPDFITVNGNTILHGTLTVESGKLTLENLIIR